MALTPEEQEAFDDRIRWINEVTDKARERKLKVVWQAINDVDDGHLRSLILVLVLTRVDDYDRTKDHYAEWMRERLSEWPLQSDN
jgi:hypothetical protein